MSMNSLAFYAVWAAVAGALIPVMAAMQGTLGRTIQSPLHASFIAVGMACLGRRAGAGGVQAGDASREPARVSVPPYAWFGGLAMGFYALSATFVTPSFGVGNFVMCVVVAQLVMATAIDQFGLFGAPVHAIDLKRAAGLALLAGGASLVALK